MKTLKAYKLVTQYPIVWYDSLFMPYFMRIEHIEDVMTCDGLMSKVMLYSSDLQDGCNVIAEVGKVAVFKNRISDSPPVLHPDAPNILYWNEKFWLLAYTSKNVVGSIASVYYKNNAYLLYEVEVANPDGCLARLLTTRF